MCYIHSNRPPERIVALVEGLMGEESESSMAASGSRCTRRMHSIAININMYM